MRVYSGSDIHAELEVAAQEYLGAAVRVGSKIHLPKILQWYRKDFGTNAVQLLQWVADHMMDDRVNYQSLEMEITFTPFECVRKSLVRFGLFIYLFFLLDVLHQSEGECNVTMYILYSDVMRKFNILRIEFYNSHIRAHFLCAEDANTRAVAVKEGSFQSYHHCLL